MRGAKKKKLELDVETRHRVQSSKLEKWKPGIKSVIVIVM